MESKGFRTVPLNLVGPSYPSRSQPISAQSTRNLYPEVNPGGITEAALQPWPGLLEFSGTGSGAPTATALTFDEHSFGVNPFTAHVVAAAAPLSATGKGRGAHVFKGRYYAVFDTTLVRVDPTGLYTAIGTIPGNAPCTFADNGSIMVICPGGGAYSTDGTGVSTLSYDFNPQAVTYINNQFVFTGPAGAYYVANPGTTTVNVLNTATAESDPDSLTAPFVFNQLLYLFSENSIEPWQNTGTGNPPFERVSEAIIENVGTLSPHGIVATDSAIYFIGTDALPYRVQSFQAEPIGTPGVHHAFRGYTITDVRAFTATFENQKFIVFVFPKSKKCWAFSESVQQWFELDYNNEESLYLGVNCHYVYNKWLVQSISTGQVFEFDFDTFTNNGNPIVRERVLQVIAGDTFGKHGYSLRMSRMRFSIESGTGQGGGQGVNPKMMIVPSYDGGQTWGKEVWIDVGRGGEFSEVVEWHNMKVFDRLVVKVRFSDPAKFVLYGASIDIQEAGH